MGAYNYQDLVRHIGHRIVCIQYGDGDNVAVKCETCSEVLVDFDRPIPGDEQNIRIEPGGVQVEDDSVTIYDEHGEIVHWVSDEWDQDPSVTVAIANAIKLYYEKGPSAIRKLIGKEVRGWAAGSLPSCFMKYDIAKEAIVKGFCVNGIAMSGEETTGIFVIALVESGLLASTWVVEGTEDLAIETARALAEKLDLNPEKHDFVVEKPLLIQQGKELICNSERVWTWFPSDETE